MRQTTKIRPQQKRKRLTRLFWIVFAGVLLITILLGFLIFWLLKTQDFTKASSVIGLIASIVAIMITPSTLLFTITKLPGADLEVPPSRKYQEQHDDNAQLEISPHILLPIFSPLEVRSRYSLNLGDQNFVFAESLSEVEGVLTPNSQGMNLSFDMTNPNNLEIRVQDIYVEVLEYNEIGNELSIGISVGLGTIKKFFCNIKPHLGKYKCVQLSDEFDYIKLAHGELERFCIGVSTRTEGLYKLRVSMTYSIGGEILKIIVGVLTKEVGFFSEKKLIWQKTDHPDKQMPNIVKDNALTSFNTKDEFEQPQEDKDKKSYLGSHNEKNTLLEADETRTYRNINLRKFREAMARYYSFDEFYILAVDLGLDTANRKAPMDGDNPRAVAQGLIEACLDEGVLDELISQVLDEHPDLADQL